MSIPSMVHKYMIARANQIWNWHAPRKMAKLAAEASPGMFKCAKCGTVTNKVQVDHIEPVGLQPPRQSWDSYLARRFCPITNLQVLCIACHRHKTREDIKKMRGKKEC